MTYSEDEKRAAPFNLMTVTLDHLEVERNGFLGTAGTYQWETQYRLTEFDDDPIVLCLVTNEVRLYDRSADEPSAGAGDDDVKVPAQSADDSDTTDLDDEPDATMHLAHMVIFNKDDVEALSDDDRDELVVVARMTVQPLLRAQVLSSTADLGFPPLVMPLLRRDMPAAREIVVGKDDDLDATEG